MRLCMPYTMLFIKVKSKKKTTNVIGRGPEVTSKKKDCGKEHAPEPRPGQPGLVCIAWRRTPAGPVNWPKSNIHWNLTVRVVRFCFFDTIRSIYRRAAQQLSNAAVNS